MAPRQLPSPGGHLDPRDPNPLQSAVLAAGAFSAEASGVTSGPHGSAGPAAPSHGEPGLQRKHLLLPHSPSFPHGLPFSLQTLPASWGPLFLLLSHIAMLQSLDTKSQRGSCLLTALHFLVLTPRCFLNVPIIPNIFFLRGKFTHIN